jgi:hydrogenase maturation protease
VLVIGFGNPGRLDDGLGPALAARLEEEPVDGVDVDADYQLMVEDAAAVARYDVVVFADAAVCGREPFYFAPVEAEEIISFSSHSTTPGGVLGLAQSCFGNAPEGYVLGIRGYAFNEFGETISERAGENLAAAESFLREVIAHGRFAEAVTDQQVPTPAGPADAE